MSAATIKSPKSPSQHHASQRIHGFVLQGGGALGAFEWGALECMLDHGITPAIVSGVSIGAINATVLCGHRHAEAKTALGDLWHALTTPSSPFVSEKVNAQLSVFGNPGMYEPRWDYYNFARWTSYYDTSPLYATLTRLVDFAKLSPGSQAPQLLLTATAVKSGQLDTFDSRSMAITPAHVVASGSLPPSFPATLAPASPQTGSEPDLYWDGGLFDNTPLSGVITALQADQAPDKYLWVFNLFPSEAPVPNNLTEVNQRIAGLVFGNKLSRELRRANKVTDLIELATQFEKIMERLESVDGKLQKLVHEHHAELDTLTRPYGVQLRELVDDYRALRALKALKGYQSIKRYGAKLNIIEITNNDIANAADFSAATIERRRQLGYRSAALAIAQNQVESIVPGIAAA